MSTINNAELTITTNRPLDEATVVVTCDVQFTDVEVNAMNMLGLQYTLHCEVRNKDLFDEDPVVDYYARTFPRVAGEARRDEHVMFQTSMPMSTLHERPIGKDKLVAQLELKNDETAEQVTQRTEVIDLDLAA